LVRIKAYAVEHGLTVEEAVSQLGRKSIQAKFLIPKRQGSVTPIGALKRGGFDGR
jgi:hypothetical protein